MDDIQVIENIVNKECQDMLEGLLTDPYFPLFFRKATITDIEEFDSHHWKDKSTQEGCSFSHFFLTDFGDKSSYFEKIEPLIGSLLIASRINMLPCRIRLNLIQSVPNYGKNNHYTPHVDSNYGNSLTAIYYVNDADGDTILFKTPKEKDPSKDLEIIKRISPKKGSVVCFPTETIHAGQPPMKSEYRAVINFNFAP